MLVALGAVTAWVTVGACQAQGTTVLLVRHADREPGKDELSAAGRERALKLARSLRDVRITAIYQTQYRRTREMAAPVAAGFALTPIEVDARDSESVARDIRKSYPGETVLVVGHSNTVPKIVAALGGPSLADIAEDDFGNLWVLQVCRCGFKRASLTRLRYGD
jgi:broad specificity phosphatase PhoE